MMISQSIASQRRAFVDQSKAWGTKLNELENCFHCYVKQRLEKVSCSSFFQVSLSEMRILAFLVFFACVMHHGWASECNKDLGPAGLERCIQLANYNNEYQWAICLSNAFIYQESGDNCTERSASYCWYPCMAQTHSKHSGSVTADCSCNSGNPSHASLPAECYNSTGDSCQWYRNCLEKKLPRGYCSFTRDPFYEEKFCKLYENKSAMLSTNGRNWWDGARRCLHDALVPFLRPWTEPSCEDILQKAQSAHILCYLNPGRGDPSICYIGCREYLKIFWSIKGSFSRLGDHTWKSLQEMWYIGARCSSNTKIHKCSEEQGENLLKIFQLRVKRRWSSHDTVPTPDQTFADEFGSATAKGLKWNTEVMDWITYLLAPSMKHDANTELSLIMVLADKKALGIVNTSTPSVNFDQITNAFVTAVRNGLHMYVLSSHQFEVWVKSLDSCSDRYCHNFERLAVNAATEILQGNIFLCGVIAVFIMLMEKLFF